MKRYFLRAAAPAALGLCLVGAVGGPAVAADPAAADQSPIGGVTAHRHVVITGSGCVDLDQVLFEREARGLHRAAVESGRDKGPWHPGVSCDAL